ncbi:MAG TPA: hypothetical protein VMU39_21815 [Solirubrobacteraceae bacterium]|nr:hypothetical protein [Solirubrobacteraceae bacterium]
MKVFAVVVAFAALGFLIYQRQSPKMSAHALEQLIYKDSITRGAHPTVLVCRADPKKKWDYLCHNPTLGEVWAFNVNSSQVTRGDRWRSGSNSATTTAPTG